MNNKKNIDSGTSIRTQFIKITDEFIKSAKTTDDIEKLLENYLTFTKTGEKEFNFYAGMLMTFGICSGKYDDDLGFYYVKNAAKSGLVIAKYQLYYLYKRGIGTEMNLLYADELYKELRKFGIDVKNPKFMSDIASDELKELFKYYFKWIQKVSACGNLKARFEEALCYLNGVGIEPDFKKCFELVKEVALSGDGYAYNLLGVLYATGTGVKMDVNEALQCYKKSAELDCDEGTLNYGISLLKDGPSWKGNVDSAIYYINRASKGYYSKATMMMAYAYENGISVEKDIREALLIYCEALQMGDWDAYHKVIEMAEMLRREIKIHEC